MKKLLLKKILIFSIIILYIPGYSSEFKKNIKIDRFGTRVPYVRDIVDICEVKDFSSVNLYNIIIRELSDVKKYSIAIRTNPRYVETIADQIVKVSKCFDLDPLVFSSLIGHESFFYNRSVSGTGAIGLGQLTSIGRKEIAQQLRTSYIQKSDWGTLDAYDYWNESLSCVASDVNNGTSLKHFWKYKNNDLMEEALKKDTVLSLTYAAMIFKISYSKGVAYIDRYNKKNNVDNLLKILLGYYNGASEAEKLNHYKQTRILMNDILEQMGATLNPCYNPSIGKKSS